MRQHLVSLELIFVVVSTGQKLLAEGHDVSRVIHAPVLVGPELSRGPSASLDFIHVESTAMLERERVDKLRRGGQNRDPVSVMDSGPAPEPPGTKWTSY